MFHLRERPSVERRVAQVRTEARRPFQVLLTTLETRSFPLHSGSLATNKGAKRSFKQGEETSRDLIFCSRFRLDLHMRTHDGRRPFLCPGCAYTCARKDNLASHVRKVHKMELEEASLVYSKDYRVNVASPRENLKQEDREEDKIPLPPCVDIDLLDSSSDVLVVLNPLDGFMLTLDPGHQ